MSASRDFVWNSWLSGMRQMIGASLQWAPAQEGDPVLVVMRKDATAEQIRGVVRSDRGPRLQGPSHPGRAAHRDRRDRQQGRAGRAGLREPARGAGGHPRHPRLQAGLARGEARGQLVRSAACPSAATRSSWWPGPARSRAAEQTLDVARAVKAAGAHILRGGAFKPRTSPYSFQGLGEEGLKILADGPRGDRPARRHRGARHRERRPGGASTPT